MSDMPMKSLADCTVSWPKWGRVSLSIIVAPVGLLLVCGVKFGELCERGLNRIYGW